MPPSLLRSALRAIDGFSEIVGNGVAWLNILLVVAVSYEVVARYAFNAPTEWAYESTYMLYGTIFMLGAAFTLQRGAHIRTDFFYQHWSSRTRGVVDAVAYLLFFFPSLILFLVISWNEGWYSFTIGEVSEQTPWRPILWPYKMVIPMAVLLLLIQGVSETIKSLSAAWTGVELQLQDKIEL